MILKKLEVKYEVSIQEDFQTAQNFDYLVTPLDLQGISKWVKQCKEYSDLKNFSLTKDKEIHTTEV